MGPATILMVNQKTRRVELSKVFLDRYKKKGDDFLRRIITFDESWIHYFDPVSQQQSKKKSLPIIIINTSI